MLDDQLLVLNPRALKRQLEGPDGPVARKLLGIVMDVEGRAKQYCPVDTGRLRASITSGLIEDGGSIAGVTGTNVKYAPPVEFGTYRMPAQSFLRRALEEVVRSL